MEKEYICRCNNCMAILFDENPQVNAIKQKLKGNELKMIQVDVSDNDTIEWIWACPNCETDEYLTDDYSDEPLTEIQPEPTPKELKVCVIDLEDRNLFDIKFEQSFELSDEDFLRLAQIKDYVYTLKQFEEQMNDCYPIDFEHCFMRFLMV